MLRVFAIFCVLVSGQALAIVGGSADDADPAVVSLWWQGFSVCSGVLVSKTAVLSAAHCPAPPESIEIRFGADASHPTGRRLVADVVRHPQATDEGAPYDFALYRFSDPVTDVVPLGLSTAAVTVGEQVRHVGFGVSDETAQTGGGQKRTVSYPVTRVEDAIYYSGASGEQTCNGDSGAPALVSNGVSDEVVGIVSDGPDCHHDGWDGRADKIAEWVRDTVAADAPAPAPAAQDSGCGAAPGLPLGVLGLMLAWRGRSFLAGGGKSGSSSRRRSSR